MLKKLLATFLSCALILTIVPINAFAIGNVGNSMFKQVLDIIILYLLIYLFGSYIIFLVKCVIYGKEKVYGCSKPTLMEKIKIIFL